jgi:uncharacterized phage protein (TIGR01671 family)
MRTIKFRAWDKENRKIVPVVSLDYRTYDGKFSTVTLYDGENTAYSLFFNAFELMQFTGLHDKNGREIYEGDIVAWNEDELADMGERIIHYEGKGQIVWVKEFCHFGIEEIPKKLGHWSFSEDARYEVLGNIYSTPDLLNQGAEEQHNGGTR